MRSKRSGGHLEKMKGNRPMVNQNLFVLGRAVAAELGCSAMRPSMKELKITAAKLDITVAEAKRALSTFIYFID
jgi:hypothetical protein